MPIPPIPNLSGHPVVAKGVLQFQSHLKKAKGQDLNIAIIILDLKMP